MTGFFSAKGLAIGNGVLLFFCVCSVRFYKYDEMRTLHLPLKDVIVIDEVYGNTIAVVECRHISSEF
jgi:hypothetical protein